MVSLAKNSGVGALSQDFSRLGENTCVIQGSNFKNSRGWKEKKKKILGDSKNFDGIPGRTKEVM